MIYLTLPKIYYQDPANYEKIYSERFAAPFTKHLDLNIQQYNRPASYPAFYSYTEEIANLLVRILHENYLLEKIISELPFVAVKQFYEGSIIEEIQSTNAIEGVRSTRKEITTALAKQKSTDRSARLWSIVNKYLKLLTKEKIDFKTCTDIRRFYDDFALDEIKTENPANIPDGLIFRKGSVSISTGTDKTIHKGVYPEPALIEALEKALAFLNDENIPLLIRVPVFHYLFGYIHPFYDGNGRTSRFITSYCLNEELHTIIGIRISVNIKKQLKKYYRLFEMTNNEFNRGDLTPFLTEFLEIILSTIIETQKLLVKKIDQLARYEEKLDQKLAALNVTDKLTQDIYYILLQAALFKGDGATVEQLVATTGKSRNTIDARLAALPKEHLLKITSTKPYRYKLNTLMLK